jgi:drug/metabolite transporter (DMT)-like permease
MWFGLALSSALFQVLRNMAMKQIGHALDEYINVWGRFTFLLPFTLAMVWQHGIPDLQPGFWGMSLLFACVQIISTLCLSKALRFSDISIVTPLWKLSIFVLILFAYFTINEVPSLLGLLGMTLSVIGVYFLNIKKSRLSVWAPFQVLLTDRGLRYALLAAFFYAPSVITAKQGIVLSDPYFGVFIGYLFASLLLLPLVFQTSRLHFHHIPRLWKGFVGMGLFAALTSVTQGIAYKMTLTSYVEAVKQVEILFALAIGYQIFQERERVREIIPGCVLMLIGIILLKLAEG